ncbi:MAG: restriction endonuclease subunit S, partial [Candidatus Thiodiazotropha sp.]
LIEKKQRLIELLKEKRQAVITQAVTKGLDPSVPMKDSGVEWLGEVPEHWFVGRLGYYGLVNNGTTPSKANDEYWFDGDVPWLSSGAVNQETVLTPSEYITRKALTECSVKMLQVGTVIVGMIGQGKTRGMSAILAVSATINQNLAAVVTDNRLSSYYLHYVFKAAYESIRNVGRGGNQAALNCEILSDMKIPVPEYDEQAKIVDAIKSRISKIDVVEEQSERSLSLLKEHRSALITAAVTGQIDVRNLA